MKMWSEIFELIGNTVKLIPMEESHVSDLWEAAKPEEIWAFTAGKIRSLGTARKVVESAIADREQGISYPFVIQEQDTNRMIGSTRFLDISPTHKSVEIGWTWYHPSVWRTRVNTECKFLLLQHAFETWDLNRVQLKTDLRNIRSQKAIERIGGVKEGVFRKDRIIDDGYIRDTVFYSILKEEWPEVKAQLLIKLQK
ncbi:GNAT family N-acetyltransferase [Bacillus sp. CGMCC 1.16607]|uniref:GNAT family N-acetyltransferase n=1 Tax=Bacillus sp. CGMCC 1.16607 TaxID=3351842 RepID=UPI0036279798